MFGYVKPMIPMLRVGELETYKGVYCGLCKNLGKSFGPLARFTLSYDFTFAAMLYCGVNQQSVEFTPQRCPYNPLKKKPHIAANEALDFCSDVAAIMMDFKLVDDIHDSPPIKALLYRALRLLTKSAATKASARMPEAYNTVKEAMTSQFLLEQTGCSLDEACDNTAQSLGNLFAMMSSEVGTQRVLHRLGYMLGRFVYICDALEDLEKDRQTGSFNPLLGYDNLEEVCDTLRFTISQAAYAYQLLEISNFKEILDNIIYLGLQDTADQIITKIGVACPKI